MTSTARQTVVRDQELLARLFSGDKTAQRAWEDFLESYSNLFLKIIWKIEKDRDTVMERYLHVCSKFAEKDFAILRKFKQKHGENPPKFTSWLGAVVRNMIVDSYRSTEGRRRIPKALKGLHDLDRKVFELYYWRGFGPEEIDQELATGMNGSSESISDILERLDTKLLRPPAKPALEPMTIRLSYDDDDF
ncbi:MAG TPA: hypothetical protein VJB38_07790 [Bacteroidota bacterium]|nr:hypothetical protein [Bacteroidota bacterium]